MIHAKPTIEKNAESILRFTQTYQQALNDLNSLDVDRDHVSFIVLIMEKIDPYTFSRFEDFCSNSTELSTIAEIENFLEKEYSVNCRRSERNVLKSTPKKLPQFTATHAAEGEAPRSRKMKCFICSEEHPSVECPQIINAKDRDAILRKFKICIFCVKHKFDFKNPCKSRDKLSCSICKDKHNITEMHEHQPPKKKKPQSTCFTFETCANTTRHRRMLII